uniref:CCHC-type domain-containing protein n=1 Tax=Tanacetum cinerariifolium TaxID=118510 RepID=A0A6L2LXK0_TANCI|nr:hypothetical protein [Tanacetum cinerariifolium]
MLVKNHSMSLDGTRYDNQRVVNIARARENVDTQVVQQFGIQCYNCKEYRHVARECQKSKRAKDATYHKEKMLLYMQEEVRFQLNVEQADWRDDIDDIPKDQELEAHYMYMTHIQEVTADADDNSGPIFDADPLKKVKIIMITIMCLPLKVNILKHDDQDDNHDLAKERDLLASLIEKLKCEIDDNKNHNKFLKSSNKTLIDKLKDLKKFQAELDRYLDVNYASNVEINCGKDKGDLVSYKRESQKSFNEYTQKIKDLNQMISKMKKELFAHQETIFIMSQEKKAQKKFHKTLEDKELEKVIALKNKIKVLDDIVYKTSQSV